MAFFTPSQSPAVVTREIDLTGIVPNVATSTGAYVGRFRWGPVETPTLVSDEGTLVERFASPNVNTTVDFHTAAYFTKYSNSLYVMRAVDDSASNSYYVGANPGSFESNRTSRKIKNSNDFASQLSAMDSDKHSFISKYPGSLGDAISVKICPVSANDSAFENWDYANDFDGAPGTSSFVSGLGSTAGNDEVHVAIVDKSGAFTGSRGSVLETFPYLSFASNAKNPDGSTNYIADVINNQSKYVWLVNPANVDSDYHDSSNALGTPAVDETSIYAQNISDVDTFDLAGGTDKYSDSAGATLTEMLSDLQLAYNTIEDADAYQIDFLITPPLASSESSITTSSTAMINHLTTIAETRKDCVVVTSPPLNDLKAGGVFGIVDFFNGAVTKSNYLISDNNWFKVFDKYNDKYIDIPAASSTAGLMARTDYTNAPWFSPAGLQRGRYFGIADIYHSPNKTERDTLYKAGINPIANIPGAGIVLYGDKTMQNRPSAFDRINVRRLFLALERAISEAAKSVLFEFNDEFTRAQFVNIVEPFLREVKGRRGITDFRVVCDETNNTPEIIDRNEFIATIFIKPARSINYVTLNFVATRTGVDFEEVVGLSF